MVPYSPGGGSDTTARLIAPKLQEALGETVVIDNRPGAGGVIGDEAVAKAAPDGHTLLIGAFAHAVNPSLLPKMPFRTPDDFAPISLLVTVPELTYAAYRAIGETYSAVEPLLISGLLYWLLNDLVVLAGRRIESRLTGHLA